MPPHMASHLASHPESKSLPFVCCDCFGRRMSKILPLESSRSPPAGKFDSTAMLLGRMTYLAMHWLKKWLRLLQNFSRALMKAILMGIAKGAATAAPLEKTRRPWGREKELERGESEIEDGEKLSFDIDHLGYPVLNSLESWSQEDTESVIEDGHFGECPEWFLKVSSGAKVDKMHLEDNTALCLIHHSISFDFGNNWECSSDEDSGLEDGESPRSFPPKSWEDCYYPQMFAKRLDIGGCFEEKARDSCHPREESGDFENDFEGGSRQSLESPFISQERRANVESSGDIVIPEEQGLKSTSNSSKEGEYLVKENLGTPSISHGFKSSLVLSLFYSPSEEDDDDDTEDWSSEDEMEETIQSSLDSVVLENGDNSAADSFQHQSFPENLGGCFFPSMDPMHSFSFSRTVQPVTCAPPESKNHEEITVSFYLSQPYSMPEETCNPPKPPSHKDPRSAPGHPPHQCCQLQTERNCDLVTTETPLVSRKAGQLAKKVRFSPEVTVHTLVVWDYASRAARRGPWEEMARDRCRFQRRIAEVGAILEPCLQMDHRASVWRKTHGALQLEEEIGDNTLPSLASQEKLCA
ncbi:protein phosphatase 1 regulatory subunit 15A [Eublepharis macularius]|uniref:Protein phosphatase 1 regulatory subunit 15A n=1 Tax=Eublepharis macularius TaxID=481883 RepID=A0AA97K0S5_EUBMA|nr:protein phosphatase 1 regulatory subunit 15A [Eublepharis macularius]